MTRTGVVPFISPSALFLRGMAVRCPSLRALNTLVARQDAGIRARCERLLEAMVRQMPYLPRFDGEIRLLALADADHDRLVEMLERQKAGPAKYLHERWHGCWKDEDDEQVRRFAIRSAVLLTEIFRLSRHARRLAAGA